MFSSLKFCIFKILVVGRVAQSIASSTEGPEVPGLIPGPANISVEIYHEIYSTVISPIPLIQVKQFSFTSQNKKLGTG